VTIARERFWDFSLRIYGQPDVVRSCIELQDRHGCDVNLLLFCCWSALTIGSIPDDVLDEAVSYSQCWRTEVVGPLRGARSWMKAKPWITATGDHAALRERIKSVELEAERLQQLTLAYLVQELPSATPDAPNALGTIIVNLERYLQRTGVTADQAVLDNLVVLLRATLPGLDPGAVRRGLQRWRAI
jgi:uncharacterized protein (TIGR02444 family)